MTLVYAVVLSNRPESVTKRLGNGGGPISQKPVSGPCTWFLVLWAVINSYGELAFIPSNAWHLHGMGPGCEIDCRGTYNSSRTNDVDRGFLQRSADEYAVTRWRPRRRMFMA